MGAHQVRVGLLVAGTVFALLDTAWADPGASSPQPQAQPSGLGGAVVYVFRVPEFTVGVKTSVFFIDGTKVATMGYQGCVSLVVPPGRHEISQKWITGGMLGGNFGHALAVDADLAPGGTYYFRFDTDVSSVGPFGSTLNWQLDQVSASEGASDVATLHCHSTTFAPRTPQGAVVNGHDGH
jgi:hypothetical protein